MDNDRMCATDQTRISATIPKGYIPGAVPLFSTWKMAIFWLAFVIGMGPGIFRGKGSRLAIWIQGNQHTLNRQASVLRWTFVGVAALMIWQGWQLTMGATFDVLLVGVGSFLLVVFLYIPETALHLSTGLDRILRRPGSSQNF